MVSLIFVAVDSQVSDLGNGVENAAKVTKKEKV
jgi:hypothetical protein